jgi:hypothetical protein
MQPSRAQKNLIKTSVILRKQNQMINAQARRVLSMSELAPQWEQLTKKKGSMVKTASQEMFSSFSLED